MASLARRSDALEVMDGPDLPEADYRACLDDLAAVNRVLQVHRPVLRWLRRALRRWASERPVAVVEVGYGGGDLLRAVHRLLTRRGLKPDLLGIDLNPRSRPVAEAATPPELGIEFLTGDAYALDPGRPVDFVLSSHVAHHMTDDELVRFLRWMEERAKAGWYVSDLERRRLAMTLFRLLAWAMRWHPIVRADGALSVARSFRPADWRRLLAEARIPAGAARIRRAPLFRLHVERLK